MSLVHCAETAYSSEHSRAMPWGTRPAVASAFHGQLCPAVLVRIGHTRLPIGWLCATLCVNRVRPYISLWLRSATKRSACLRQAGAFASRGWTGPATSARPPRREQIPRTGDAFVPYQHPVQTRPIISGLRGVGDVPVGSFVPGRSLPAGSTILAPFLPARLS